MLNARADLITLHNQPHRTYHNMNHINHCLAKFHEFKQHNTLTTYESDVIKNAIWFHDSVYNPYITDGKNEEDSAWLMRETLGRDIRFHIDDISVAILATKSHDIDQTPVPSITTQVMLDVDLCGFAESFETVLKNAKNIRKEYDWVDTKTFIENNVKFLNKLLARKRIYYTDYFYEKNERIARENIVSQIKWIEKYKFAV